MAKSKVKKRLINELPKNMLPQNILPMGERVEENKNIYISQAIYKEIHKFTQNKTTNESGGVLVGSIIEEFGKTNIVISGFIEAKYSEATPTTLKFTHETWDYVHKEIEKKHKGKKIVGWIHTHPDFGIFLSEYDKFIQENFFKEDYQVAYVIDPIQNIEGFYFWINDQLQKCQGFYIYDKTGVKITIEVDKDEPNKKEETSLFHWKNIAIAILSVAVVFLFFSNISTGNTLEKLEKQQKTLADSANQSFSYMQQQIWSQQTKIQNLTDILKKSGMIVEPEVGTDTEDNTETNTGDHSASGEETTDPPTASTTDEPTTESPAPSGNSGDQTEASTEGTTGTVEEGGAMSE